MKPFGVKLATPRRAPATTIVAVVVTYAVAIISIWYLLFRWSAVDAIARMTYGLVQPTLLAAGVILVLVGAVLRSSSMSLSDIGLTRRDVPRAVLVFLFVYTGLQLALIAVALVSGRGIYASAGLSDDSRGLLGSFIAQLFGTAIVEEVTFRGFLLRQLIVRARDRFSERGAHALAVAAAAFAFALIHVPQQLHLGFRGAMLLPSLSFVWLGGVLASYLYLRSGNLAIVIVLHALFNEPAPLVAAPVSAQVVLAIPVLVVIVWIELRARARSLKAVRTSAVRTRSQ